MNLRSLARPMSLAALAASIASAVGAAQEPGDVVALYESDATAEERLAGLVGLLDGIAAGDVELEAASRALELAIDEPTPARLGEFSTQRSLAVGEVVERLVADDAARILADAVDRCLQEIRELDATVEARRAEVDAAVARSAPHAEVSALRSELWSAESRRSCWREDLEHLLPMGLWNTRADLAAPALVAILDGREEGGYEASLASTVSLLQYGTLDTFESVFEVMLDLASRGEGFERTGLEPGRLAERIATFAEEHELAPPPGAADGASRWKRWWREVERALPPDLESRPADRDTGPRGGSGR